MSDHDAFLRAICENPAEDTPRLVFADWLDEHADAFPTPAAVRLRAAFIRDDVAASQRDEYDPVRLRWELVEKPRREAESWVNETLPPIQPWGSFLRAPLFRRGFPWALTVPPSDGAPVPALPEVAVPLESVRLGRCGHHAIEALRRAPWRDRLTAIEFEHRGNTSPTGALSQFAPDRVERLAFLNAAITAAETRELVAGPLFGRLASLRFTRAEHGTAVAESLVRESARSALSELHLVGCRVPWEPLGELLGSPAVARLRSLSLGGDLIASQMKFGAIADLVAPALRSLDLSDDAPRAEAVEALAAAPFVSGLHRLDLSRCSLNRDRTRLLAGGAFDNLRVLRLYGNSAGNEGVTALARSPHLAGLLVLDLGYTQVGDEGIEAILESPLADGLVLLDLTGSPASDEAKGLLKARMGDRVLV